MSTPSGKPFYPTQISDYAPKHMRRRYANGHTDDASEQSDDASDRASPNTDAARERSVQARPSDDDDKRHREAPLGAR